MQDTKFMECLDERVFAGWQEAARKDIERAFGVFQMKFQWVARPMLLHRLNDISNRMCCCVMLHNMCVSDRVMDGDVSARHNPSHNVLNEDIIVEMPDDLAEVQGSSASTTSTIGIRNMAPHVQRLVTQKAAWNDLNDNDECLRLLNGLKACHHGLSKQKLKKK